MEATRLRSWAVEESYFLEFMYPYVDYNLSVSMSFLMVPRVSITTRLEVAWSMVSADQR